MGVEPRVSSHVDLSVEDAEGRPLLVVVVKLISEPGQAQEAQRQLASLMVYEDVPYGLLLTRDRGWVLHRAEVTDAVETVTQFATTSVIARYLPEQVEAEQLTESDLALLYLLWMLNIARGAAVVDDEATAALQRLGLLEQLETARSPLFHAPISMV